MPGLIVVDWGDGEHPVGAATDYALLLVARYREELTRQQDRHLAMRSALGSATSRASERAVGVGSERGSFTGRDLSG